MIDQALLDRVQKQAWFHRYPRGWPILLFLIASITTAVSVMAIERADRQTRRVELDRNLTEISSALQRRVTENIALLRAGGALFATQPPGTAGGVTRTQFAEFAQDLQGNGKIYGSLGVGWAPLIPVERLADAEVAIQDEGQTDFIVFPRPAPGQRAVAPVRYILPQTTENQSVIAYDMFSESVRREAMEKAIRLGGPVASGKVHLMQDSDTKASGGFMIYMPVMVPQGGRRSAIGFVYSPFRAKDFLASASELYRNDQIDVAIYDDHIAPETLLAEQRSDGVPGPAMERRIDVGNHSWVVQISDKKAGVLTTLSRIVLFFGVIASLTVMGISRFITKRAAEDRRVLEWLTSQASIRNSLTRELNHRVKNTLANVLSIAALTRRRSRDIDDFTDSLTARIRALSATHDLLSQSDWGYAALGDIVRSELAPYMEGEDSHVVMSGPDIKLAPNDAMSLGLAIHELATNAAKYGALSTIEGRIHVYWVLISPDLAEISWREEGGPSVTPPSQRGFGRDLIEKIVAHELKSEVDLQFKPSGVECRLKVPVRAAREFMLRAGHRPA
ncbi:signal transduction histidine kinase [Novosphingobium sp. Rr 2-17]|uniref:CHASE domain-containing protein n=1 Tax=Novosphingobium sp. Rr 2-17 TaxID=555793 RepID=UPI000269A7AD|nr:CHASE domain-containing protein [Novosphingobium sp. Rr 2-17]EIZ80647.1 signal transduction histidine kinase [Novosphingobium sp. Rr 2-17]